MYQQVTSERSIDDVN